MLSRLAIAGYRSLRDVVLPLGPLNVVTGANGSGKSSLYRALRLLAEVAQGRVVQALAAEGGLHSVLWAGPETISRAMRRGETPVQGGRRNEPVALKLGFSGPEYGFAIDLGLPIPSRSAFAKDPVIKVEAIWTGELLGRSNEFAVRRGPGVRIRGADGAWRELMSDLDGRDSMMTHCCDPREAAETLYLREWMRSWRFYDHLRTDRDAPARQAQVGVFTPILAGDGADFGAAVQTIQEIGAWDEFEQAIADAFAGAEIVVEDDFRVAMRQPGLLRPLHAAELSDGTLRYLLLITALLSPRPPPLLVLNEPETSLHPALLAPLARQIIRTAERAQTIVVTHSAPLAEALSGAADACLLHLEKDLGETLLGAVEPPAWRWPTR